MIETAITIAQAIKAGYGLYETASAILKGKQSDRYLEKISNDLGGIRVEFERLSNHITMAKNLDAIQDVTQSQQRYVKNLQDVREALEPVQRAIGDDILSSAMIWTPEKMKKAMGKNPWEVLLFIQPVALAKPPNDPNFMPIIFEHSGVQYIGWQAKGTLPMLFDCHYKELWKPADNQSKIVLSPQVPLTDKSRPFWKRLTQKINSKTQYRLGQKYLNGEGVAQDLGKALACYRKAAEQGHAGAQADLGWIYRNGSGVAQDLVKAVQWYRKAAEQGNADAQCNLGFMYQGGKGVPQDANEAIQWFQKAAEQGHFLAKERLRNNREF